MTATAPYTQRTMVWAICWRSDGTRRPFADYIDRYEFESLMMRRDDFDCATLMREKPDNKGGMK